MFPTSKPFWKRIEDISRGPRTRSQEQHQKLVKKEEFDRGGRLRSICYERIRQILRCSLIGIGTLIIFIVITAIFLQMGIDIERDQKSKCKCENKYKLIHFLA